MKFSCDKCDAQYMISDEKVGPKGVRVRCKKCGNVISVRRPVEDGALAEERPAPAAVAAVSVGGAGAAVQGSLDAELGQAFDHAFGGEPATTPAPAAPASAAAEAARVDAAVPEPGALQLPAGDELPAFAVAAQPARTPAPVAPPATEWYVAIGQAQVGPLPLEEVRRKWEGADVGPDSLVWRPGMGDWAPLSTVADLAAYLAPFPVSPRQSRTPAASGHQGPAASPTATPAPGGDFTWKPVGASALAALASEEIASRTPEPRADGRGGAGAGAVRSLVEQMELPDGGGVDPTGAIPLPMKALETTGEHRMERISSVARGAEEIRQRRSATRGIAIAVVALLVLGGGAAAWLLMGRRSAEPARPAPVAASAPLPAAPVPEPTPAKPAEPAVASAPQPAEPAKTEPAPAEAPRPEPAAAETAKAEGPKPEPAAAAPAHPAPAHEAAKPEPARMTRAQHREALRKERLAQAAAAKGEAARAAASAAPAAAAAPAPEQPRKRRDVLDFESNDAALEAALGTKKPAAGSRSVYVPPAPSGTALQDRVTDSQVNETILGRVSALQQCVQEQKARDADGTGVLKMHWSIAPDGAVRDPKCITPEFASSPIAQCVAGVLRTTRFPKSKSGRQDVTFPIKF